MDAEDKARTPSEAGRDRLLRIKETLFPTRRGYCAEPLDIDDARWMYYRFSGVLTAKQWDIVLEDALWTSDGCRRQNPDAK